MDVIRHHAIRMHKKLGLHSALPKPLNQPSGDLRVGTKGLPTFEAKRQEIHLSPAVILCRQPNILPPEVRFKCSAGFYPGIFAFC